MTAALSVWAEAARTRAIEVEHEIAGTNAWDGSMAALPQELFVELIVSRGKFRLHSAGGRGLLRDIPTWTACVAAMSLVYLLRQATEQANGLEKYLIDALPEEAEDRLHGLIETRMDGWAAQLELEILRGWNEESNALAVAVDTFEQALDTFDRALFAQRGRLARLPDSVFHNYRETVSFAHLDPMPWWLDGRLG